MIKGLITTRDVFTNGFTIARCFGVFTLLRCCAAIISGEPTTFLACVYPRARPEHPRSSSMRHMY